VSPLRLALVITELEVGGAEQCLVRLACGLDRAQFEPVVFCLGPLPPAGRDQLVRALAGADVEVHSLGARSLWHFPWAVRGLTRLLRRQQPEIVQTFLFHANVVGTLAARRAGVPHVLLGVRVADPSRWRGMLERASAARAAGVVCVSQAAADECRTRHKFPAGKLIVIPNGIDAEAVARTPPADLCGAGLPLGRRAITFVGRLDAQKGTDWLVRDVAPAILGKLPRHDLLLVGDGPQRPQLARLAREGGYGQRIHFALWRADALALMAASDLIVLPSRYEGMPNAVLEAMALARAVVATRAEGVCELLGPAAEQQTAAFGDTAGFASRVVGLIEDERRREQAGRENQRRAREQFSLATMIESYARLYRGLAGHGT
jgi:glycosyltransferase involved in cell wall biosynthesis